jgi:hypothetical protein
MFPCYATSNKFIEFKTTGKVEVKFVPLHVTKEYDGSKGTAPLILAGRANLLEGACPNVYKF